MAGDNRITPLGAKLRHYKLDELPGLWDVLVGNMSFVGPRPDVPGYADQLKKGSDREVLKLRPGITGPATLKYRLEDEMISDYVAKKQSEGDNRPTQVIAEGVQRQGDISRQSPHKPLLSSSLQLYQGHSGDILHRPRSQDAL